MQMSETRQMACIVIGNGCCVLNKHFSNCRPGQAAVKAWKQEAPPSSSPPGPCWLGDPGRVTSPLRTSDFPPAKWGMEMSWVLKHRLPTPNKQTLFLQLFSSSSWDYCLPLKMSEWFICYLLHLELNAVTIFSSTFLSRPISWCAPCRPRDVFHLPWPSVHTSVMVSTSSYCPTSSYCVSFPTSLPCVLGTMCSKNTAQCIYFIRDWIVSPKGCWNPNSECLSMWPYLEIRFLQMIKLRWGHESGP